MNYALNKLEVIFYVDGRRNLDVFILCVSYFDGIKHFFFLWIYMEQKQKRISESKKDQANKELKKVADKLLKTVNGISTRAEKIRFWRRG